METIVMADITGLVTSNDWYHKVAASNSHKPGFFLGPWGKCSPSLDVLTICVIYDIIDILPYHFYTNQPSGSDLQS